MSPHWPVTRCRLPPRIGAQPWELWLLSPEGHLLRGPAVCCQSPTGWGLQHWRGGWYRAGQCPTASFQQVTSLLCAPVFSSVRFQLQGSDSIKPPSLLLLTPPFLLGYTQFNIPPLLQCLQHLLLGCDKVQMPWVTFKALRNVVPTYPFSLPPHYLLSMADILFLS